MELEQGKIVKWENKSKQTIVWMVTDDITKGVVIHSDNLSKVGTITDLSLYDLQSFRGSVNINSS